MDLKIVLYGIGRGLNISQPSIEKKLITPAKAYFPKITKYHFVQIEKEIANERSGDFGQIHQIKGKTFKTINPVFIEYQPAEHTPDLYKTIIDSKCMHGDNHRSSINLIKQLNLLKKSTIDINDEDIVMFCRDDIFIESFNLKIFESIKNLKSDEFFVSCYDWQNGINDRFMLSKGKVAKVFKNRIDYINDLIKEDKGINGERLMKFVSKEFNLKPISYDIKFSRVRLDESLVKEKRYLPFHRPSEVIRIIISFARSILVALR
tara:strand:- start:350 stop:1138 length:789 start_codon:yes stop_codon:yes gene_type:complete